MKRPSKVIPFGMPWDNDPTKQEVRVVKPGLLPKRDKEKPKKPKRDGLTDALLVVTGVIIAAAFLGSAYVSVWAQYHFALEHGHGGPWEAAITAGLLDAAWLSMALLALVEAIGGRSSFRARLGATTFFAMSVAAQLLYAERTIEGYLVAAIGPTVLAWMVETFVVVVRRRMANRLGIDIEETPILTAIVTFPFRLLRVLGRILGRFLLWCWAWTLDRKRANTGVRQWVLANAPLSPLPAVASIEAAPEPPDGPAIPAPEPAAAPQPAPTLPTAAPKPPAQTAAPGTKKAQLIDLYEEVRATYPPGEYGNVTDLARELGPQAGYGEKSGGTVRNALTAHIAELKNNS